MAAQEQFASSSADIELENRGTPMFAVLRHNAIAEISYYEFRDGIPNAYRQPPIDLD